MEKELENIKITIEIDISPDTHSHLTSNVELIKRMRLAAERVLYQAVADSVNNQLQ